ncbi:NUDIX domain-containing protein [Streptomyces sp. ME01-18a]|uniref:NUDIX domain-containing protein n=1 Tax=Streptomyces sp. ME01-18a TaxID=3028669 RepID=UPI0029BD961C|nr:NUDIX domain-containing protein [Streptomyces sp. ME01-18a]MDX3433905.1 NUDIX domain-containing protein [Streptomyces sp. ME01-18a]
MPDNRPQTAQTAAVELPGVRRLRLVEVAPPRLTGEQSTAMTRMWDDAVATNPSLFDGPTVVCSELEWEAPETLLLTWYRATYRLFLLRLAPVHSVSAPSVYVTVSQPTDDGRLLVGRMASSTAAPGRWQLPGGTVEPPAAGSALDMVALRRHAARELAEEVGRDVSHHLLELWAVTRGDKGNVGLHFRAPARPVAELAGQYNRLVAAEGARGRVPELDRIAFIASDADVAGLGGHCADFLPVLAARHAACDQSDRHEARR